MIRMLQLWRNKYLKQQRMRSRKRQIHSLSPDGSKTYTIHDKHKCNTIIVYEKWVARLRYLHRDVLVRLLSVEQVTVFDDARRCQRQKHARAARHLNRVVQVVEVGHRQLRLSATATGRVQSTTSPASRALSPPTHAHTHSQT